MYIMCIVCLGYLSFLPTSAIASVLCTCISMYAVVKVKETRAYDAKLNRAQAMPLYTNIQLHAKPKC